MVEGLQIRELHLALSLRLLPEVGEGLFGVHARRGRLEDGIVQLVEGDLADLVFEPSFGRLLIAGNWLRESLGGLSCFLWLGRLGSFDGLRRLGNCGLQSRYSLGLALGDLRSWMTFIQSLVALLGQICSSLA